jgi:hypothetical protein
MKILDLSAIRNDEHGIKVGMKCPDLEPNILEDTLFIENDEPVGFYIKDIASYSQRAADLANIADSELRSERVPKTEMSRGPQGSKKDKLERLKAGKNLVTQYSAILGGVAPKPHMRRPYPTISSVHSVKSARNFVKAMLLLCKDSEKIVKEIMPEQHDRQRQLIADNAPPKYRFGNLFTSSISNFNIAADYHIDTANLKGCMNVIIAKRMDSKGGNTNIPAFNATVDSADNSMLAYPAWKDIHGVTPITQLAEGGYRNTLVFYPLGAFKPFV